MHDLSTSLEPTVYLPDGADGAAVLDKFRDLEHLLDLAAWASCNRFLDEDRNSRKVFDDLCLYVSPWLLGTAEHGRGAHDKDAGCLIGSHVLDKVVERLVNLGGFVGGAYEGLAFLLEDILGALCGWVDQSDDLEARAKFATCIQWGA